MSYKKTIFATLFIILLLIIAVIGLGDALTPLLISFGFTYLLFPTVKWLEKRNIKRQYAALGVFALLTTIFLATLIVVIPSIVRDLREMMQALPDTILNLAHKLETWLASVGIDVSLDKESLTDMIKEGVSDVDMQAVKPLGSGVRTALSSIVAFFLTLLNILMFPLFFFYVICDYEMLSQEFKSLIPLPWLGHVERFLATVNRVLSGFIRGQGTVVVILSALYILGLLAINVKFGAVIGFFTGLLSFIPFVGPSFGLIVSSLVSLGTGAEPSQFIKIAILFGIIQILETYVVTPRLVGNKVGLRPLTTIIAVIIGGNLFGFWGILLAVPIFAVAKSVFYDLKDVYQQSSFYKI
ncbi:MAG: AI-2E family transporter [Oligoflexales bacterium]